MLKLFFLSLQQLSIPAESRFKAVFILYTADVRQRYIKTVI